jgi:tetratricopeptide (TPR) repeat protein
MATPRPPLPDSYEGLLNRARLARRANDLEGAIALYRRLVEKLGRLSNTILDHRPELRDLHRQARLELAAVLRFEGRFAEAIEVEEVLLETHPDQANVWRTDLARLRLAKGEVEAGLAELRTLVEENPDDPALRIILGRETCIEGRFAESQATLDQALALGRGGDEKALAAIHYERFRLFREMGRLDDAIAAWEEAVRSDSGWSDTVRDVYQMLTDAGRYSEARRYVDRDRNALQAGYHRGLITLLTGSPAEAKREWQKVAALDPAQFEYGHDAWVESVLRLGDPIPALEWLQESLPQIGTPRLLILSGIGWAMHQDREVASVLFQQAINLLRRARPPKQKLDSADWRLLDALVADGEMKTALKPYFAVVETVWG